MPHVTHALTEPDFRDRVQQSSDTGKPVPIRKEAGITIDDAVADNERAISTAVLFGVNKIKILPVSLPVIDKAARLLTQHEAYKIIVDGYTDTTGNQAYNQVLSVARANAVKRLLEQKGIDARRIRIEGHGSKQPAADNKTRKGRMENRRAVMHLTGG